MNKETYVTLLKGRYVGRRAKVVAAGTFNVFGVEVVGIKVGISGAAGFLILESGQGYYEETPPRGSAMDRFQTLKERSFPHEKP